MYENLFVSSACCFIIDKSQQSVKIILLRSGDTYGERNDNYSFQQLTIFLFIRLWWRRLFLDRTGHVDVAFLLLTVGKCAKNRQASSPSFPSHFRRLHPTVYIALVSSSAYFAGMLRHRGAPKTRSRSFYFWRETSV